MGNNVKYCNVTFNDAQNNAKKTYKIPQGSKVELTNSAFTINKDCTINVTLPQYVAASVWDSNHDGKIDQKDIQNWKNLRNDDENFWGHDDMHTTLSKSLEKAGSSYSVIECGGGADVDITEEGFSVSFENMNWMERMEGNSTKEYDRKEFGIYFPEKK